MGEGEEKRERGGGKKEKGDLIRERRAFFSDQSRRPRPIICTPYIYTIASIYTSSSTVPSTPLPRFTREDQQDSFAHTWSVLEPQPSSSRPLAHGTVSPPPSKEKKRKKQRRHTVCCQLITQRSIRERELEQSDSSGSHCHQLPTLHVSRREIRSRKISSFASSRCYLLHPNWRPPLVPLRIISHGEEPALSTDDDPRSSLTTTLHDSFSLRVYSSPCAEIESTIFRREARHRRTHDPRGSPRTEHKQQQQQHKRVVNNTRGKTRSSSSSRARLERGWCTDAKNIEIRVPNIYIYIRILRSSRKERGEGGKRS